ncbi:hypothetical protein EYF80_046460 [Liparis tanakae]|uniref:Uncharacterized protein n=1 Tax=Liparis tanakae TaxID=230148 RepID=A0A4Z2FRF0_9TELE|nr:hypothetical protein EYF80_046460 [Liparis tanakae]
MCQFYLTALTLLSSRYAPTNQSRGRNRLHTERTDSASILPGNSSHGPPWFRDDPPKDAKSRVSETS